MTCERCGRDGHSASAHCDQCGQVVRSQQQLDRYADTLGVDWVLCSRCEYRPGRTFTGDGYDVP